MAGGKRMRPEDVRAIHEYIKANPDASIEEVAYSCHRSATTVRAVKRGAYADLYDPKREALRGLSEPEQLQIGADLDELREKLQAVSMIMSHTYVFVEQLRDKADQLEGFASDIAHLVYALRQDAHVLNGINGESMEAWQEVCSCLGL
jgi:phosphoglycerate-specific signal transduction histidine kinase